MKQSLKIEKKKWLSANTFGLEFYAPGINPKPGQFFQLRVQDGYDPFLSRPISVASFSRGRLLLVIKVVGKGTTILSNKKEGEEVVLFGPYGNGARVPRKKSLLIAGGIGAAPLYFLGQRLYQNRTDFTFLYGAKSPAEIILKRDIIKIATQAIFVTEQGGRKRMTAVSALKEINTSEYQLAYACGPREMIFQLKTLNLAMPVYAFCEDFLGCGTGLCLGCAIKYYGEYKRLCKDGPVFELKGIEFN